MLSGFITKAYEPMMGNWAAKGFLAGLTATMLFLVFLLGIGIYIYFALAWQDIAKKMKYKDSWLAWIPFANLSMILELGEFHWAWIFLLLVPFLGWIAVGVLLIIAQWRIFQKRKYPGFYSLSALFPKFGGILYLIAIGFLAWDEKK